MSQSKYYGCLSHVAYCRCAHLRRDNCMRVRVCACVCGRACECVCVCVSLNARRGSVVKPAGELATLSPSALEAAICTCKTQKKNTHTHTCTLTQACAESETGTHTHTHTHKKAHKRAQTNLSSVSPARQQTVQRCRC